MKRYALLYLATLIVRRFDSKDELRNAITDALQNEQATLAFRYYSDAGRYSQMEAV